MPLARTSSVALVGVTGHVVEVEVDIANGLVGMILVGLPDTALREARDRIRAAIVNSGEQWSYRRDCKTSGHVPPESSPQEYVLPSRRSLKRPGGPRVRLLWVRDYPELRRPALPRRAVPDAGTGSVAQPSTPDTEVTECPTAMLRIPACWFSPGHCT